MSVLIILSPGFPKDETDTTCLPAFQQFALSLKKLRPAGGIEIITFQYPFEKKNYTWHGIPVKALGGKNKGGILKLYVWFRAYRALQKIKSQQKIDGIVSLWVGECSLIGKYFGTFNNVPHYSWIIGQDAKPNNSYVRFINPKAEVLIAMSDFLKNEYFKNHGKLPFMVAENGINESSFPSFNSGKRNIDLLAVGSLIKLKNHVLFVEIVSEIKKIKPDLKAIIAGSGEEEGNLKTLVKEMGLSGNVHFTGLVSHKEVFDLMNDSKVFLHTSHYEGNSTVLMEALYSGCYTFSTCPLSERDTKNLKLLNRKEDFVVEILELLSKGLTHERVLFNTMDRSAEKILRLFQGSGDR